MGNVRVSYTNNGGVATIIDENNFYPFGLKQNDNTYTSTGNNYKYNGKELQEELGLNITAMDFRQYDNAIGRFNVIDPLTEQDFGNSPYAFAGNNPVLYGDPSGLKMAVDAPIAGYHKSLAQITDEILGLHDDGNGGGGGGNPTQALQQQMWGPNFWMVGTNEGNANALSQSEMASIFASVGIKLTTNSDGELGYWKKSLDVYSSASGYWYDHTLNNPGYVGEEMTIKTVKTWVGVDSSDNLFDVRKDVVTPSWAKAFEVAGNTAGVLEMAHGSSWASWAIGGEAAIPSISNGLKWSGRVLGGIGIGVTLYQYGTGKISGTEATVDTIMGVVGFIPGGAIFSLGYFAGKAIYEYSTDTTLFQKPN